MIFIRDYRSDFSARHDLFMRHMKLARLTGQLRSLLPTGYLSLN